MSTERPIKMCALGTTRILPQRAEWICFLLFAVLSSGCGQSSEEQALLPDSRLRYHDVSVLDAGPRQTDSHMEAVDGQVHSSDTGTQGLDMGVTTQDTGPADADTSQIDGGGGGSDSGVADQGIFDGALPPGPACGDIDFVDFTTAAQREGMRYVYNGQVQGNQFRGSCTVAGTFGADTVLRFRAPSAGDWVFDTQGSEIDTNLYVRFRCLDSETELSCSDDVAENYRLYHSKTRIRLEVDEYIFLVVDTYQGLEDGQFRLTAKPFVENTPPILNTVRALVLDTQERVALALRTVDPDGPPARVDYELRTAEDEVLLRSQSSIDSVSLADGNGFRAVTTVDWWGAGDRPSVFINVRLIDFDGSASQWTRLEPTDEVPVLNQDAVCDGTYFRCPAQTVCIDYACGDPQQVLACPPDWPVRQLIANDLGRVEAVGDTHQGQPLRTGSCGGGTAAQVFSFTPPEPGVHLVTVIGQDPGAQPVLYARRFCDFDEVGFNGEMGCSDRATPETVPLGHERSAALLVDFAPGEASFIFVDSSGRAGVPQWQGQYQLNIEPAKPPIIDVARTVFDLGTGRIGLYAAGRDLDFERVSVRLFNVNDEPIFFAGEQLDWPVDLASLQVGEGTFTLYGAIDIADRVGARAARSTHVLAQDRLGMSSMPFLTIFTEPAERQVGEICDPNGVVDGCVGVGLACVGDDISRCVPERP